MKYRVIFCFVWGFYLTGYSQDTTRLSLLFLGDIMQHDSQIKAAYADGATAYAYDYAPCFQFVKPYIESVDLAIGNLELTLAGPPYKGYPQFSAPDELLLALKNMGMDVLVTANNHSVDRGKKGIDRTIEMLDSMKLLHTGTFSDTVDRMNDYPLIFEKNGFRIALLNYTFSTNGIPVTKPNVVNMLDTTLIRKDIAKAKEYSPDIIIVFTHWGIEYQALPSAQQKKITEFCFRKGVNLVIGSHPHVLQPMEWRKEKNQLITYSLGNFVSGQRDRYKNGGAMIRTDFIKVVKDSVSSTMLDSAGYILEWVYRTTDSKKDYYVLPVPTFERDTTGFIKDEASRLSFKTFAEDSRKLFAKYNKNVQEINQLPGNNNIASADSIEIKRIVEGFYSWYAGIIKNEKVYDDFYPRFMKRADGMTSLDFSSYKKGLIEHNFTSEFIERKIIGYKTCVDNLSKIKYEAFLKFDGLNEYEEINCAFTNVHEWFQSMEGYDGAELIGIEPFEGNKAAGTIRFFYMSEQKKENVESATVFFLREGKNWKICDFKFGRR